MRILSAWRNVKTQVNSTLGLRNEFVADGTRTVGENPTALTNFGIDCKRSGSLPMRAGTNVKSPANFERVAQEVMHTGNRGSSSGLVASSSLAALTALRNRSWVTQILGSLGIQLPILPVNTLAAGHCDSVPPIFPTPSMVCSEKLQRVSG